MQRTGETQLDGFRSALRQIKVGKGRAGAKIAQLQSLKYLLLVSLKTEQKKKEMRQLGSVGKINDTRTESTQCSGMLEHQVSEMCQSVSRIDEGTMCKRIVYGICSSYKGRDKLNDQLYQLQCLNGKVSSKYQKYIRANDYQNQSKMLRTLFSINQQVSHLNSLFCKLKHSIATQHDNLRDYIKVMKVRHTLVRQKGREERKKSKAITYFEGQKRGLKRVECENENRNQFLVNLG